MKIYINECIIEIDEVSTREFYNSHISDNDCDCSGCRNFRKFIPCFSDKVRDFFKSCGIDDMKKIAEIIPFVTLPDDQVFYGGFYHVAGKIIGGNETIQTIPCYEPKKDNFGKVIGTEKVGEKKKIYIASDKLEIEERFSVYFSDVCSLLPEGFPTDAVQLEIEANVPWIIEDENTY